MVKINSLISGSLFESIGEKLEEVLTNEIKNQKILADSAGADFPDFTVLLNRQDAIESTLRSSTSSAIVHIYADFMRPTGRSGRVGPSNYEYGFNIECLGFGLSSDSFEGHVSGDYQASKNRDIAVRLSRSILMSGQYSDLFGDRSTSDRVIKNIEFMPPNIKDVSAHSVSAAVIKYCITANEENPSYDPTVIDGVNVKVKDFYENLIAETTHM